MKNKTRFSHLFQVLASSLAMLALVSTVNASTTRLPVPTPPVQVWQNYVIAHNYDAIPQFFGFKPNVDPAGNVQKVPLASNTIPVVIRCERPEGCSNYNILIAPNLVSVAYSQARRSDDATRLGLEFQDYSKSGDTRPFVIKSIYIPADRAGHGERTYTLTRSINEHYYYGGDGNDGNRQLLVTNVNDVMAVIYIKPESLKNTAVVAAVRYQLANNINTGMTLGNEFGKRSPLLTDAPYNQSGVIWQLIDSTTLSPGTSWGKSETVTQGTTDTQSWSMAITVGLELGGGPFSPAKVTEQFKYSWGQSFSLTQSSSTTTSADCGNPSGSTYDLLCGFYQGYGATQMIAPGFVTTSYNAFTRANQNPIIAPQIKFSLGDMGSLLADDTQNSVGSIYPLSGTVFPTTALVTGVLTIQSPN